MMHVVWIGCMLLLPAVAYAIAHKIKWLAPILLCYTLGIVSGNLFPDQLSHDLLMSVTEACVVLSIPLLLMSSNLLPWLKQPGKLLIAFALAVVASGTAAFIAFAVFHPGPPHLAEAGAMMFGVYSGGTPNLNAIGMALGAPETLFVWLNGIDMVLSGVYLLGLFAAAAYMHRSKKTDRASHQPHTTYPVLWKRSLYTRSAFLQVLEPLGWAILIAGLSVGSSLLFFGSLSGRWIIVSISTLGILASFVPRIKGLRVSYALGDYLMLLFAFSMGAMAQWKDISQIEWELFGFCALLFGCMLTLHMLLTRVFKIDWMDTVIASTAAVFGPPFIGPVAAAFQIQRLIAPGIALAVLGNAVGTYLGLVFYEIVKNGI